MTTPEPQSPLDKIWEHKFKPDGSCHRFRCDLLARTEARLTVLFISESAFTVDDVELPIGTVTFGYFWAHRPYNCYHWMKPTGQTLGHYFNVSDETTIGSELRWRDLYVDVLYRPPGTLRILDEDEVPAQLAPQLHQFIQSTTETLRIGARGIAEELESESDVLWQRIFSFPRAT
jgi:predicted RNA-binding protein associated with RNAse of E/G family